jgi:hypothetical protein
MDQEFQTRSREPISGQQICSVTFDGTQLIGGSIWDIPFTLPFPCNAFFLASVQSGDEANSAIMYFTPLQKPRNFSFNLLSGTEQIFYLNNAQILLGGVIYRGFFRFKEPVTSFFAAFGSENGHISRYTIAATNDPGFELHGGIYA